MRLTLGGYKQGSLTVHFNDLVQVGENGGQFVGRQELLSLQRLGEDHLKDT